MGKRRNFHNLCCCLCFASIALTSCSAATSTNSSPVARVDSDGGKGDSLFHLDLKTRTVVQAIEAQDGVDPGTRFVQIEVVSVTNPKRYALLFQLSYQPRNGEKIYLGSFSLYPADNPGKFIVATQGKLKNEGSLALTMVLSDEPEPQAAVKVSIKKMTFRRQ